MKIELYLTSCFGSCPCHLLSYPGGRFTLAEEVRAILVLVQQDLLVPSYGAVPPLAPWLLLLSAVLPCRPGRAGLLLSSTHLRYSQRNLTFILSLLGTFLSLKFLLLQHLLSN